MNFIKNFYNKYIDIKLSDYKGFESDLAINKLLFFVFIGLALATMFINYYNGTATLILRKLTRTGSHVRSKLRSSPISVLVLHARLNGFSGREAVLSRA